MSRSLLDDNGRTPHGMDSAEAADDEHTARAGGSDHDAGSASTPRLRDDPAGRRSLTGVEFRRRRSRG